MLINRMQSMRWLFAELLVIVLGILMAFQVEEWRQQRLDKQVQALAFAAVLKDLGDIETSVTAAIAELESSTLSAAKLVRLMQSDSATEEEVLDSISKMGVYLLGESEDQSAYAGLLAEGRFSGIGNDQLNEKMRTFFTAVKPWIYSLNIRLIGRHDALGEKIHQDIKRVPAEDFDTSYQSERVLAVPVAQFPSAAGVQSDTLEFIHLCQSMIAHFQRLLTDIESLRTDIRRHLES